MKRLAVIILAVTIVFTSVGCSFDSDNRKVSETEESVCVEHSAEAVVSMWGACEVCEAMAGYAFGTQCETWDDIVAIAGFNEYSYELSVSDRENIVVMTLTFSDVEKFSDEDFVRRFMRDSYLAFVGISWFAQNKSSIVTPDKFQKHFVIRLYFPGGTIVCQPDDYNRVSSIGILTSLVVDEDSPNKFRVERLFNFFFNSVVEKD